jgi:hypothetical protein
MLRKLRKLRGKSWPDLYDAPVRVYCTEGQCTKTVLLPFLLPHELVYCFAKKAVDPNNLYSTAGLAQCTMAHLARAKAELNEEHLVPLGLWADGVPCNWDRSESIDTWAINWPGQLAELGSMRIVVTALMKKFVLKGETHDDIGAIIAWSFQVLASGVMPSHDHQGTLLKGKRAMLAGKPLPKAILAEVRADWAAMKATYKFPMHNELAGICWACKCTPTDVRDVASTAAWKQPAGRLGHYDCLRRMRDHGITPSPIFSCPALRTSCFLFDWLHCADIGITLEFLASVLLLLLPKIAGANLKEKCSNLFIELKAWYRLHNVTSKLDNLTLSMLKQPKKFPKLRARAAECRALVPWVLELCNRLLSANVEVEATAKQAMHHLNQCYTNLSPATFNADHMKDNSVKFGLLYVGLEARSNLFSIKPKLHLFSELTQMCHSCPSLFWTYRDEEFGGTVAALGRRRGGAKTVPSTGRAVLLRFTAKHSVPIF